MKPTIKYPESGSWPESRDWPHGKPFKPCGGKKPDTDGGG